MTDDHDIAEEKRILDKSRPSKTRVWPDNGIFCHYGLHKDLTWRAVVCASEGEAKAVLGPDVERVDAALAYMEPEEKVVWETPGVEFVKVEFLPPLWVRRDQL
jgi:hypothetical protein